MSETPDMQQSETSENLDFGTLSIAPPSIMDEVEMPRPEELYATACDAAKICVVALMDAGFGDLASTIRVNGEHSFGLGLSETPRMTVSFDLHHARPRVQE